MGSQDLSGKVRAARCRRVCTAVVVCFVIVGWTAQSFAQVLWRDVRHGMTVDEVIAAVPGTVALEGGDTLGPDNPATELLRFHKFTLADKEFQTAFFFSDKTRGLVQVTLLPENDLPFGELKVVADSLVAEFRAKYGKELSFEDVSPSQPVPQLEATWVAGDVGITIVAFDVGGTAGVLNVNYRAAETAESVAQ